MYISAWLRQDQVWQLYDTCNNTYNNFFVQLASKTPSYGYLIDLLEECSSCDSVSDALYDKFRKAYPQIKIGRQDRFYETVKRIAAPTKPSLRGESKLCGPSLLNYRETLWIPRIRMPQGSL